MSMRVEYVEKMKSRPQAMNTALDELQAAGESNWNEMVGYDHG